MHFGTWLRATRAKEREDGVDHVELACYASKLTPYIRDHMARALQDMEELYAQLPSAAVPEENQRDHWENGRQAYITRMRESLDHIGAALNAVGCTDEELDNVSQANEEEIESDTPEPASESGDEVQVDEESQETTQIALAAISRAVEGKS